MLITAESAFKNNDITQGSKRSRSIKYVGLTFKVVKTIVRLAAKQSFLLPRFAGIKRRYVESEIRYKRRRYGGGPIFDATQEDINADRTFAIAVKRTIKEIKKFLGYASCPEESNYMFQLISNLRDWLHL